MDMNTYANRQRLVSAIRPTNEVHIGNFVGGIKGVIDFQEQYDAHYFVADIHSLTTHPKSDEIQHIIINTAKNYLAAGLDPNRCVLYVQSSLAAEICQLHTYLSMVMPVGELMRCPTYKEKARRQPDNAWSDIRF